LSLDFCDAELFNNFLDRILEETLVGKDLLGDETVLFEIAINYFPGVLLIDGIRRANFFKFVH
jgi:hypothetical protein